MRRGEEEETSDDGRQTSRHNETATIAFQRRTHNDVIGRHVMEYRGNVQRVRMDRVVTWRDARAPGSVGCGATKSHAGYGRVRRRAGRNIRVRVAARKMTRNGQKFVSVLQHHSGWGMLRTSSQSASGNSTAGARRWMPPQFTRTWISPIFSTACGNTPLTLSRSARSHSTTSTRRPRAAIWSRVDVLVLPGRCTRQTSAPACASASAHAWPMPANGGGARQRGIVAAERERSEGEISIARGGGCARRKTEKTMG